MRSPYLDRFLNGTYNKSEVLKRALHRAHTRMVKERDPRTVMFRACNGFSSTPLTLWEALSEASHSEWDSARLARLARQDANRSIPAGFGAYMASMATDGRLQVAA